MENSVHSFQDLYILCKALKTIIDFLYLYLNNTINLLNYITTRQNSEFSTLWKLEFGYIRFQEYINKNQFYQINILC